MKKFALLAGLRCCFQEQTEYSLTLAIRNFFVLYFVELRIAKVKRNLVCSLNSTSDPPVKQIFSSSFLISFYPELHHPYRQSRHL